ncbi:MAG: hypothetical protein JG781_848 [Peptococcaceae bacterium]|nr:hypothetical protein [Peptococcaceae bacterium]
MIMRFVIYGIIGWALEIFWTGMGALFSGNWQLPGFTYLWMFPIYGLAVLLEPLHDEIGNWPWYIRGLVWVVIIFAIEYTTGWLLGMILGRCPWDYSGTTPFHVRGLIRLDYAPAWFIAGLLFERLHRTLDKIRI